MPYFAGRVAWVHTVFPAVIAAAVFGAVLIAVPGCATAPLSAASYADHAATAVRFPFDGTEHSIPEPVVQALADHRIIVLGESHYSQEHQEFVSALLPRLYEHGVTHFAVESQHANGPLYDMYVKGADIVIPDEYLNLDRVWLDAARAFNAELSNENRPLMTFAAIDMNHWPGTYRDSMFLYLTYHDHDTLAETFLNMVRSSDPEAYQEGVRSFARFVRDSDTGISNGLSPDVRQTLIDAAEIEIRSVTVRSVWNDETREAIITDNTMRVMSDVKADGRLVLNVGRWHAQNTPIWPHRQKHPWVAERLKHRFGEGEVVTVACFAVEGVKKPTFRSSERVSFDLMTDSRRPHLARAIARRTGPEEIAFFDMHTLPTDRTTRVVYGPGERASVRAGEQFDALFIYPRQTVLHSSTAYEE